MTDKDKTYVYATADGHIEVELTGRKAKTVLEAMGNAPARENWLVEIQPLQREDGRWKKFVQMEQLNEIIEDE